MVMFQLPAAISRVIATWGQISTARQPEDVLQIVPIHHHTTMDGLLPRAECASTKVDVGGCVPISP